MREQVGTWIACIVLVALVAVAAKGEEPKGPGCGLGERIVAVWSQEPKAQKVGEDGGRHGWCLFQITWGPSDGEREEYCLQAYRQRWSDWPGCPNAELLEVLGRIDPPEPKPEDKK